MPIRVEAVAKRTVVEPQGTGVADEVANRIARGRPQELIVEERGVVFPVTILVPGTSETLSPPKRAPGTAQDSLDRAVAGKFPVLVLRLTADEGGSVRRGRWRRSPGRGTVLGGPLSGRRDTLPSRSPADPWVLHAMRPSETDLGVGKHIVLRYARPGAVHETKAVQRGSVVVFRSAAISSGRPRRPSPEPPCPTAYICPNRT